MTDTLFSPAAVAEAIKVLTGAGVSAEAIKNGALVGALELAAAGNLSVEEASAQSGSAYEAFVLGHATKGARA